MSTSTRRKHSARTDPFELHASISGVMKGSPSPYGGKKVVGGRSER